MTWQEIKAWQELNGIELDLWELRTLMDMSEAYIGYYYKAKSDSCPPPMSSADKQKLAEYQRSVNRKAVSKYEPVSFAQYSNVAGDDNGDVKRG